MSYSWAETITQYVTTIKASHVSELHTNINSERTFRALPAGTYTQTPTQYTDKVTKDDIDDMKAALDEAHTANVCTTHRTTHDGSENASYYSANMGSHLDAEKGSHYPYYYGTNQTSEHTTYTSAYLSSYDSNYQTTVNWSYSCK